MKNSKGIFQSDVLWNVVFAFTMIVYAVGLFIPIMEPDAAVYAQVSMEMHDRGDFLSIFHKGVDWLDKPHFPFWMSALSYEVFGVSAFAYKLPAVIFVLLGAYYTYLFGKRFYSAMHGWLAVILLITAEHIIISNQDVRAEPFMTGLLIMGLYHLACLVSNINSLTHSKKYLLKKEISFAGDASQKNKKIVHISLGSLAIACLIMTKGLFTIIPIASGVLFTLVYQKKINQIFHWQWLAVLLLTLIFISPALYGYYQQFDKHPEKVVFGETGVSGVKFFLWTSQWGRFTNTGPIKGKGDVTFFIHTMLWAYLPWAFAGFYALFVRTKQLIKKTVAVETFTYFGFITLFIIFSLSRFQLSFYLNPLFPLISIFTVDVLMKAGKRTLKTFSIIHLVLSLLLVVGLVLLHIAFRGTLPTVDSMIIVPVGILFGLIVFLTANSYLQKIIFATAIVVLSVNYYLNRDFYPALLTYQAESEAAYYMRDVKIPAEEVVFVGEMESVADVIMHSPTRVVSIENVRAQDVADKIVFTSPEGRAKITDLGLHYEIIDEFSDFPVTRLTGKFINKNTRFSELQTKYLLQVGPMREKPVIEVTKK